MKFNFGYIVKKIINKIQMIYLKKYFVYDNVYLKNINDTEIKKILFYFPDYEMMHLGDHLFFEPLIRILKTVGYDVAVAPAPIMKFYFEELGYKIDDIKNNYDLVISRMEFLPKLKECGKPLLLIDTASAKIMQPICYDLIQKVFAILKISLQNVDDKPQVLKNLEQKNFNVDKDKKYIVFNNYIDSGAFRIGKKHHEIIVNFVKNLKKQTGFSVVHVGSQKDKINDKHSYDVIDIDLRGKTSVRDLFDLVQLENIVYCVSYDAFIMHLFAMADKKTFVLFRGRFLKKYANMMMRYLNPPFRTDKQSKLIEYI